MEKLAAVSRITCAAGGVRLLLMIDLRLMSHACMPLVFVFFLEK
jgi:hypothetical protein